MFLLGEIYFTSGACLSVKPEWPRWNQEEPNATETVICEQLSESN